MAVPHHPELRMASRDFAASWSVSASPENPQPNVFSKSRAALHPPSKFRDMGRTGSQPPKSIRRKAFPDQSHASGAGREPQGCEASKFRISPQMAKLESTELLFFYKEGTTHVPRSCACPVINLRSGFHPSKHNPANLESERR